MMPGSNLPPANAFEWSFNVDDMLGKGIENAMWGNIPTRPEANIQSITDLDIPGAVSMADTGPSTLAKGAGLLGVGSLLASVLGGDPYGDMSDRINKQFNEQERLAKANLSNREESAKRRTLQRLAGQGLSDSAVGVQAEMMHEAEYAEALTEVLSRLGIARSQALDQLANARAMRKSQVSSALASLGGVGIGAYLREV